jgi:gluconolactonase
VETAEFSEGPVFDADGNLYFTHGRFVSKLAPDGELTQWLETQGANGHKILPDGTHLVCEPGASRILRVSREGQVMGVASESSGGEPLRAPNDLTLSPEGGFYFTDPGGSREAPIGTVHYVGPDGVTHTAAGGMSVPNGLVLSPDKSILYVAETGKNRVLAFPVEAPGRLGEMRVFTGLPEGEGVQAEPDGMAVDEAGNLYVAHLGMSAVQVIAPNGKWLRSLAAGNFDASNLAFGGTEMSRLYVTGSVGSRRDTPGRVYRLELPGVRGVR